MPKSGYIALSEDHDQLQSESFESSLPTASAA